MTFNGVETPFTPQSAAALVANVRRRHDWKDPGHESGWILDSGKTDFVVGSTADLRLSPGSGPESRLSPLAP